VPDETSLPAGTGFAILTPSFGFALRVPVAREAKHCSARERIELQEDAVRTAYAKLKVAVEEQNTRRSANLLGRCGAKLLITAVERGTVMAQCGTTIMRPAARLADKRSYELSSLCE
jgi:hypothetical protein